MSKDAVKQPEVFKEIDILREYVANVDTGLTKLLERLDCVMSKDNVPMPDDANSASELCQMGTELRNIRYIVETQATKINNALERLEI